MKKLFFFLGVILLHVSGGLASVLYVDVNSVNPTPPYAGWDTAAVDIQSAIDAAVDGDHIWVTNGIYQTGGRVIYGALTNRVAINKAVTVQSVNGPTATVIRGNRRLPSDNSDKAVRCVYLTNNAILAGFTLTNGETLYPGGTIKENSGGGAFCESTNSYLVDCLIISNAAYMNGGGECFGSLSNCVLVQNVATAGFVTHGGGAYYGLLCNCLISNNFVGTAGGGAFSNILNNCILTGNVAGNQFSGEHTLGGGAYLCVLNNCVISNNVSFNDNGGGAASSVLNNCLVCNNYAGARGGGGDTNIANNCLFIGNVAGVSGGAANVSALNNCLIYSNYASNSVGAVFMGVLRNCTVTDNSARDDRGGIEQCTALNCILYYNGVDASSSQLTNCCIAFPMFSSGFQIFTNSPLFVNSTNDFHLQAGSPCINAGNNAYIASNIDFDGNPRIMGGAVDVGAYEYQSPASVVSYAYLQQYGLPTDGSIDFADSDGDGLNNWQEWKAGTNPTNAVSVLQMMSSTNGVSGTKVTWQSVSGVTYFVQRSADLSVNPAFSSIQSNILGQAGTTTYTDANAGGNGPYFYRVGVQ